MLLNVGMYLMARETIFEIRRNGQTRPYQGKPLKGGFGYQHSLAPAEESELERVFGRPKRTINEKGPSHSEA